MAHAQMRLRNNLQLMMDIANVDAGALTALATDMVFVEAYTKALAAMFLLG